MAAEVERESVTALERGFAVLHCFKQGMGALTHQEISRATSYPKATVSRITQSLVKLGYLDGSHPDGRFRLTAKNLSLATVYLSTVDIRVTARPMMVALAEHAKATVNLCVREGDSLVVVETVRSEAAVVSVNSRVGFQFPILQTGIGRAYLACLPEGERAAAIEALRHTVAAHEWRSMRTRVAAAIAGCNRRGFCCLTGEWRLAVNSVAAPICLGDHDSHRYVLNCAAPDSHMPPTFMDKQVGPRLLAIANHIRTTMKETF